MDMTGDRIKPSAVEVGATTLDNQPDKGKIKETKDRTEEDGWFIAYEAAKNAYVALGMLPEKFYKLDKRKPNQLGNHIKAVLLGDPKKTGASVRNYFESLENIFTELFRRFNKKIIDQEVWILRTGKGAKPKRGVVKSLTIEGRVMVKIDGIATAEKCFADFVFPSLQEAEIKAVAS